MKKWLLGLLCAGACVAQSLGANFTQITNVNELTAGDYVVASTTSTGAYVAMLNVASNNIITHTALTVTEGVVTDPDASIVWTLAENTTLGGWTICNSAVGYVGYLSTKNTANFEDPATAKSAWTLSNSADGGTFEVRNVGDTTRLLQYNRGSPRFACYTSVQAPISLFKAGGNAPAVRFDRTAGFTVEQNTSNETIVATASGFDGTVSFDWTGSTGGRGDGTFFFIDTSIIEDYEAKVLATDGTSSVTNSIAFSVVAPVQKYSITIDSSIVNGSVTTDPEAEAAADATVTVTATEDSGYTLESITVNGSAITGTTFTMPAEPVTVSATFVEQIIAPIYFQFESGDLPTSYSATEAQLQNTGSTAETLSTVAYTLQRAIRGNGATDKKEGMASARLAPVSTTNAFMYNTEAFSAPVSQLSFKYATFGDADTCDGFVVQTSTDGTTWTDLVDLTSSITGELQTYANTAMPADTYYIQFKATSTVTDNKRRMNIDEIQIWTGAISPAVRFDRTAGFTVEQNTSNETIVATASGFDGTVSFDWTGSTGGRGDGTFFFIDTSIIEDYEAKVLATDGTSSVTNSIAFSVVAPVQKYSITIDSSIVNGSVTTDPADEAAADATVTVTATADSGYTLESITVNGSAITGTTFTMPAEPVTVSATFVEQIIAPIYFQFESGDPGSYGDTEGQLQNTGSTAETLPTVTYTLQRTIRGNVENDRKVGGASVRLAPVSTTNAIMYNTEAFSAPVSQLSFQYAKYGSDTCDGFVVQTSTDGTTWTDLVNLTESITDALQTYSNTAMPADTYYIQFKATNRVNGNTRRMNIDEIQIWTGAIPPAVRFNRTAGFTVEQNASAETIVATASGFSGTVTFDWTGSTGGTGEGDTFTINTATIGDYEATVVATDGTSSVTNTIAFSVVAPPQSYTITVAPAVNGTVTTTPSGEALERTTVTVTATPASGYVLDSITVNGAAITGTTFTMPGENVTVAATFVEYTGPGLVFSPDTGIVGVQMVLTVTATGGATGVEPAGEPVLPEGSNLTEYDFDYPSDLEITVTFIPDVAGAYTFYFSITGVDEPPTYVHVVNVSDSPIVQPPKIGGDGGSVSFTTSACSFDLPAGYTGMPKVEYSTGIQEGDWTWVDLPEANVTVVNEVVTIAYPTGVEDAIFRVTFRN